MHDLARQDFVGGTHDEDIGWLEGVSQELLHLCESVPGGVGGRMSETVAA